MALPTKKVRRNKPFKNARGQYNFDGNTNLGLYPHIDDKFLKKDLYSINEGEEVNEAILSVDGQLPIINNSHFTIDSLIIHNSGYGDEDLKNVKFDVWIIDSGHITIPEVYNYSGDNNSYGIIKDILDNLDNSARIYTDSPGNENAGWYPPSGLITDGTIFTNLWTGEGSLSYGSNYNANPNTAVDSYFNVTNLNTTINTSDEPSSTSLIYVIVNMEGDLDHWLWSTDHLSSRIQVFSIPIADVWTADSGLSFNLEYGDSTVHEGWGGEFGKQDPAFRCSALNIRVSKDINTDLDYNDYPEITEYINILGLPNFISNDDYDGIVNARPTIVPDWASTSVGSFGDFNAWPWQADYNFYPGTEITTMPDTDIQSYYSDDIYRFKASSPTTINLDFKIYEYTTSGNLLPYYPGNNEAEIKFKFFVMDWDDKENEIYNWDSVFDHWVKDMDDFVNRQQDGLFKFGEISYNGSQYITDKLLNHTYISPGLKSIKAIVFSYLLDTDGTRFQILRWKFVTIRIYLDTAKALLEDFSDIGGADFVTLPWPHTTPVISGISQDSQYITSIENVLASGKLSEVDIVNSSLLFNAKNNDELGDYLGYTDFEQTRVFQGPYSMAELLKITESMVYGGNFYPHTDDTYWDGENNTFPTESCVGMIFINDNMDQNLRESCTIELNSQELEGDIIRDSSGNGNRGILIGDYKIDKPSKDIPIRRKTEPKISETDSENGAI